MSLERFSKALLRVSKLEKALLASAPCQGEGARGGGGPCELHGEGSLRYIIILYYLAQFPKVFLCCGRDPLIRPVRAL